MVEVAVADLRVDRASNSPVVLLRERQGDRILPIWIGPAEAHAIALELQALRPPRPLTHDLLKQVLTGLGGTLRRVVISRVQDNTYYAELLIHRGAEIFQVDARPSDSIALALRLHAPIFVGDDLLADAGAPPAPGEGPTPDPDALKHYLERLDPQDFGRFQP